MQARLLTGSLAFGKLWTTEGGYTIGGERSMKMRSGIFSGVLAAVLGICSVTALRSSGGAPDQKATAVDEVFEDLTKPGSPGCALGVYRDGQMLYEKGYGLANIEENVAITPKSVFDIDSVTTDEEALTLIARQKSLNFVPGSEYLYSNSGFFLLSVIVKRVSGKTLKEFAAENIFTPLGMTHTQYRDEHRSLVPERAMAYDQNKKKDGYVMNVSYFEQTGDGAVHTSVEDLLKWDENFYTAQVGGKDFLAEIQERGKLNSGKVLDYA